MHTLLGFEALTNSKMAEHSVKEAVEKHVHEHFPSHEQHAPHKPGNHSPQVISTHEAEHNEEFHTVPRGAQRATCATVRYLSQARLTRSMLDALFLKWVLCRREGGRGVGCGEACGA